MARTRPFDPLLETDLCIAELSRHFGVSRYRIQEIKEWRLVKFRPGVRGGFDAWLAKPIQFLDVPIYMLGQAAKMIGLKSSRTLNRWCKDGYIELTPSPKSGRFYVTPRQLIEAKRFKESRHGGRKPDPENLLRQLAKHARRDGGPPVDNPRKLWPSDI
jgi:hypothetical protein